MIDQLFQDLCALDGTEALALGGSRVGAHFDQASDYDVYLYCKAPIPENVRRAILSKYCTITETGNRFWEYEDNCQLKNGIDLDVIYRNLDDFTRDIADVVEYFRPRNAYTTCMWHNLLHCKIIYDRDGRLTQTKRRFTIPYPSQLKKNIMEHSWNLLCGTMPAYEGQIRKALKRADWVSVNNRTAAFLASYFDFLFALNELTHPGEKRLVKLCLEQCRILPARFEENLNQLFRALFCAPDQVPGCLECILSELERTAGDFSAKRDGYRNPQNR